MKSRLMISQYIWTDGNEENVMTACFQAPIELYQGHPPGLECNGPFIE